MTNQSLVLRIGGHQKGTEVLEVIVDAEDYARIAQHKWTVGHSGGRRSGSKPVAIRRQRTLDGHRTITLHREILGLLPKDHRKVLHINGNGFDNRKANLAYLERKAPTPPPLVAEQKRPDGPCVQVGGNRPRRHGPPSTVRWARVAPEDLALVEKHRWTLSGRHDGRVKAIRRERQPDGSYVFILMHREIMGLKPGDPQHVDHRNGDPLDNRRSNLRVVTAAQNAENRPNGIHLRRTKHGVKQRTSQYRGVVYDPKYRMPWATVLRFPAEDQAGAARQAWEREFMPYADPSYDGPET